MKPLSAAQTRIVEFMLRQNVHFIDFYFGDVGTEKLTENGIQPGRGAGYYFQYCSKGREKAPQLHGNVVDALRARGILKHDGTGLEFQKEHPLCQKLAADLKRQSPQSATATSSSSS